MQARHPWRGALLAGALAVTLPTAAFGGLFTPDPGNDIRGLLDRLPASEWSADLGGFSAMDFAVLRETMGVAWPQSWPARGDAEDVMRVFSYLQMPPAVLRQLQIRLDVDPLAAIGASALDLDGMAEIGFWSREDEGTVLAGAGLADAGRIAAALGTAPRDGGTGGLQVWPVEAEGLPGGQLIVSAPDVLAFVGEDASYAPIAAALSGEGTTLADLPEVEALLQAVDGPSWSRGGLAGLWAGHPDLLRSLPGYPEEGWPADAALPEYELFAVALRHDEGDSIGLLALVYADAAAAARAATEMTARSADLAEAIRAEAVSVAIAADSPVTVLVESRAPVPQAARDTMHTPFVMWTTRLIRYLDLRPILP